MVDDDLEPVELEPVELEPVEDGPRPPSPPIHLRRSWIPVIAAVVAAWIAVAVVTRSDDGKTSAPSSTTRATAAPKVPSTRLPPRLLAGLRGVGSGHFAVVVNSEIHVVDANG